MRLTTLFILLAMLSASASSIAQSVSLQENSASLLTVFKKIKKQTGYTFFYRAADLREALPVSASMENVPLEKALTILFDGQPLAYDIQGKTIFLTKQKKAAKPLLLARAHPTVKGYVLDSLGRGLDGVSIRVLNAEGKRTKLQTSSNIEGYFELHNVPEEDLLEIAYMGYITVTLPVAADIGTVVLQAVSNALDAVEVMVNTGYQILPKERATGSFVHIDNKMLNRTAGPDIIARLEGLVPGLLFNRTGATGEDNGTYQLESRGRATIMSETQPLIVLDNFPYEGRIEDLNPNDIESITVLKDAAAASIWGARAGNGVIVITSKQGQYNRKTSIALNHNTSVTDRPDLFYDRNFNTSAQVMAIEKEKFEFGHYDNYDDNSHYIATPYADLLLKLRNNAISQREFDAIELKMRSTDVRHDMLRYFYQPAIYSQTNLSVSGGSNTHKFFLSAALDQNKGKLVGDKDRKISLNFQNSYKPIDKLEMGIRVYFTERNAKNNGFDVTRLGGLRMGLVPYSYMMNDDGTPAAISHTIRDKFIDEFEVPNQLRWDYRPLEELELRDRTAQSNQWQITTFTNYELLKGISLSAQYAVSKATSATEEYFSKESFYVRDLVNQFTQANGTRIVPHEGILRRDPFQAQIQHSGRAQLSGNRTFGDHGIAAIVGGEIRQSTVETSSGAFLYGYNKELGIGNVGMNHSIPHPKYRAGNQWLPRETLVLNPLLLDRNLSYYGNVSYTYLSRYILSGSMRWDGSNIFGVKTNQKGVPLWSTGVSWDIAKEAFLEREQINALRLRVTYGKAGNVNNDVTSMMVTGLATATSLPHGGLYAYVTTPGNPSLRWETVNTVNFGLDFGLFSNRLNGSIEYFRKDAHDLIGDAHIPPSTGINRDFRVKSYRYNYASLRSVGWDLHLQTKNTIRSIKWTTNWILSVASDKVLAYYNTPVNDIVSYVRNTPYEVGQPINRLYARPWYGLDSEGRVIAYDKDGNKTTDYNEAYQALSVDDLKLVGRTSPPIYGSVLNNVSWRGLELSFLLSWKGNYHFRRTSIFPGQEYGTLQNPTLIYHDDLNRKWKKAGDELITSVPKGGDINGYDAAEFQFYLDSEALVSRGDHVALQNINVNYTFPLSLAKRGGATQLSIFGIVNELGIIWKADRSVVNPNTPNARYPQSKMWTAGARISF